MNCDLGFSSCRFHCLLLFFFIENKHLKRTGDAGRKQIRLEIWKFRAFGQIWRRIKEFGNSPMQIYAHSQQIHEKRYFWNTVKSCNFSKSNSLFNI